MNKINRAIRAIWQIIKNPWLLNKVLDDDAIWKKRVEKHHYNISGLPVVEITKLLPELDDTISPYSFLDGGSLATDLLLLRGLARKTQAENYLEIGTWRGESVANIAPLVKEAVTINLPDSEIRKLGLGEDYVASHRFFSRNLKNVTHVQANSKEFDFQSLQKKFDLIFVDGGHNYDSVLADTASVAKIVNPENGVIVWHDYARNPEKIRWEVLCAILDGLPTEMHQHLYHISNTLCAIYYPAIKKQGISSLHLKPFALPTKYFEVSLKCNQIHSSDE